MQVSGTRELTREWFEQLFHRYGQKLERIAYSYVRDKDTAQDIVNECFAAIWGRRESIEIRNMESYLYQAVRNESLKYRRDRNLKKTVYEKILMKERCVMDYYTRTIESCNPEEMFSAEILEICRRQIAQMPELRRQIFTANKFEGKSYREIADRYGITTRKVDYELQRAISSLRLSLKDYLTVLALFISIRH